MSFNEFVLAERSKRGWSQRELAIRACISALTISKIERGDASPVLATAEQICKAFEKPYTIGG